MIICCPHNPCPDRPRWFLGRFTHRPWRCAQCGRLWVTKLVYSWMDPDGYEWHDITPTEAMAQKWLEEETRR